MVCAYLLIDLWHINKQSLCITSDLESIMWLEEFLRMQTLPMVIVSHDREFLNQVCNKIVHLDKSGTTTYEHTTYSKYLTLHSERLNTWQDQYDRQQRQFQEEEKWLRKAQNDPAQVHLVKSRQLALERAKSSPNCIEPPPRTPKFRFNFPPAPRSPDVLLEIRDLTVGFDGSPDLFTGLNWDLRRGDRVALVGPNGSGKTSLLKILSGQNEPRCGSVDRVSSAKLETFAQDQADLMDGDLSALEALQEVASSQATLTELRGLLGQFMFKGAAAADKKVRVMSGGEKARLALCRLLVTPANVLLLDEVCLSL